MRPGSGGNSRKLTFLGWKSSGAVLVRLSMRIKAGTTKSAAQQLFLSGRMAIKFWGIEDNCYNQDLQKNLEVTISKS
jgi:hypothetical protein